MHLDIIDHPDDPRLREFHAAYQQAFILPDETEELSGFQACLSLNHGAAHARLRAAFGPFREVCVLARDEADGSLVGGANLIALSHEIGGATALTANLNYIFVPGPARGRGWFSRLLGAVTMSIPAMLSASGQDAGIPPLVFIEQNDPLRLDAADYARESAHSGIDQLTRLRIWAARGARVVDIAYVQPALSSEQRADDGLVYSVLGSGGSSLDSCLLASHLRGFFGISVLKGKPLLSDPVAACQIEALAELCRHGKTVPLLDPAPALHGLPADAVPALVASGHASLREWLRARHAGNVA